MSTVTIRDLEGWSLPPFGWLRNRLRGIGRKLSLFKIVRIILVSLLPVAWDFSRHWLWMLVVDGWRWVGALDTEYLLMAGAGIAGAIDLERLRQRKKRAARSLQDLGYVSWSTTLGFMLLSLVTNVVELPEGGTRRKFSFRKTFLFLLGVSFTLVWELAETAVKYGACATWQFFQNLDAEYWGCIAVTALYLLQRERWRQQSVRDERLKLGLEAYRSWSDKTALWLIAAVTDPITRLQEELRAEEGEALGKC